MPAGIVLFIVVGALLIGLFVNAADILRTAERQEQGWQRTVGIAVMKPVAAVSHFLFLDRPREVLDAALGRSGPVTVEQPPTTTPTSVTTPASSSSTTSTTLAVNRRTVTADEPLTMYVGGDSMVGQFGPMLQNRANQSGMVETEFVYEFESGLSRPDFVDWPARLEEVGQELDPDVFVLYFGGNDAQAIYMPDGTWIDFDTPEWEEEYRRRVDEVMTMLEADGRWIYWMGLPVVASETFQPRVDLMNSIYQDVAAGHPRVTFIEARSVFTGPEGGYSEYLTDASGDLVDMRLDDGVHYTTAGAIRLAEVVYQVLAEDWDLPPS
ncbi:MAG TPA: DUF459 domain-containing protein [Acidimicrobiia bacterium]|nr:DUF459 domain-containing protein [Acidimicrobiia bacterium]